MRKFCTIMIGAITVAAGSAGVAHASLVTSLSGGTTYTFGTSNYQGPGPQTVAPGITWSSTNASIQGGSVYGFNGGYGFSGNGFWDGTFSMIGLNDSTDVSSVTDTMTIAFATPVQS